MHCANDVFIKLYNTHISGDYPTIKLKFNIWKLLAWTSQKLDMDLTEKLITNLDGAWKSSKVTTVLQNTEVRSPGKHDCSGGWTLWHYIPLISIPICKCCLSYALPRPTKTTVISQLKTGHPTSWQPCFSLMNMKTTYFLLHASRVARSVESTGGRMGEFQEQKVIS